MTCSSFGRVRRQRRFASLSGLSLVVAAATVAPEVDASPRAPSPCVVGAYRGPGGDFAAITERPETARTGEWRYTFRDGRFGSTRGGPVRCAADLLFVATDGREARWPRISLRATSTRFRSGDVMLAGLLLEPKDTRPAASSAPPLVVLVHGSESTPSIHRNVYPYILAAQGISAFVYDKRGAGASQGKYTQNFVRLAQDVAAASSEARRLARGRYSRFGLFGGSQGGWVAPRAAAESGAEFVAVGFGLLINPLEEDSEQVQLELRAMGHGADALEKARKVTDATGALMAAHFTSGYEALAAVRKAYGREPWFATIKGEFTGDILASDEATLRREGRARYDNLDIDWRYDAVGELGKVTAPQLWVIAGADREAPPAITLERLESLRRRGRPIEIAVFPGTDHGMVEFEQAADGSRRPTRITEGYFRLLADWIHGRKRPPYGAAQFPAAK